MKQCLKCKNQFEIYPEDKKFYEKINVSEPTLCPECRQQRRLSFRNERNLYYRICDLCGKRILSCYHPDAAYKTYCNECFFSDKWDGIQYGRDFDFDRPFFEQFADLVKQTPKMALMAKNNENADYVNLSGYNKNCYLIIAAEYNEDCLYGRQIIKSKDCIDALECFESEHCYEVTDVHNCYELFFSSNCENCRNSMFLYDCRGCSDCFFCSNLRNKTKHVFNKPYSDENFERKKAEIIEKINSGKSNELKVEFNKIYLDAIHKNLEGQNNQNSSGNFLNNCKNCWHCFDLSNAEDCRYVYTGFNVKDSMDISHTTDGQWGYEIVSFGYDSYNCMFGVSDWSSHDAMYFYELHFCSDCFGCSGLVRKKYCILNKQYTREEYEELVPKIIEHMKKTGEYGEFLPAWISPFAYNESFAFEYFPGTKEEVLAEGLEWREPDKKVYQKTADLEGVLSCEKCGKSYRLTPAESKFYKKYSLPNPANCFDCRHMQRMRMRPGRKLYTIKCFKCGESVSTVYPNDFAGKIYCENCYLKEIY